MSVRPEEISIACEAPDYLIVETCGHIGFETPMDVRWSRMPRPTPAEGFRTALPWRWLFGALSRATKRCRCGQVLSAEQTCTFLFEDEEPQTYVFCQCPRCKTMFWEEG